MAIVTNSMCMMKVKKDLIGLQRLTLVVQTTLTMYASVILSQLWIAIIAVRADASVLCSIKPNTHHQAQYNKLQHS